tara:strand:+ start:598 stop:975 length:378 start_codon:yes stop_codon:yes gene_type:complete
MKNFKELYEGIKKVDVVQRKKMARRMAKMAKSKSFQFKKQKAALKMRDPAKLQAVAKKKVVKSFRDKFYPGYEQMNLQQRVVVDQKLNQKYGKKIDKMVKKAVMKLKKQEVERVKQARAALRDEQ